MFLAGALTSNQSTSNFTAANDIITQIKNLLLNVPNLTLDSFTPGSSSSSAVAMFKWGNTELKYKIYCPNTASPYNAIKVDIVDSNNNIVQNGYSSMPIVGSSPPFTFPYRLLYSNYGFYFSQSDVGNQYIVALKGTVNDVIGVLSSAGTPYIYFYDKNKTAYSITDSPGVTISGGRIMASGFLKANTYIDDVNTLLGNVFGNNSAGLTTGVYTDEYGNKYICINGALVLGE